MMKLTMFIDDDIHRLNEQEKKWFVADLVFIVEDEGYKVVTTSLEPVEEKDANSHR
jgi:hypothetical protein